MCIMCWSSDVCSSELEHRRIVDDFRSRLQRIAKADIDCQINPGAADRGDRTQPETAIVEFFANAVDTQRVRIEHDAVFGVLSEDVPECRQHRGFARVTETKKIKIARPAVRRSEEHTSELQSLMRNSYAVFCLKKKNYN